MNIRSLTRGDGVVIGAAVLLFIASFLDNYSYDGDNGLDMPSLWSSGPVLLGVVLAGLIGAALVVVARALPQPRKVAGLELGPFGVAFTLFAAWSALGNVIDGGRPGQHRQRLRLGRSRRRCGLILAWWPR